ncbi:hypothetical protein IFR05_001487 [Cadophora sp. M221]|nr:hypothetical protein IFR05_001487 [Cadophora sp. M221]
MATTNPLADTNISIKPVSLKTFCIAGINTDVFGLDELSPASKSISCLWLLHPRLQTKEIMASVAASCINEWNQRPSSDRTTGLIAAAFDQRNHGGRKVHDLANQAWREGNATHAQDMFSIYHGTALDTSLLIDHLGSYIFHGPEDPSITQHLVMGISLGGHSAWQVLLNEPRVTAGIVIIGCPDYINLMTDRARLSKLPAYTSTTPPGSTFLGSSSFPSTLLTTLQKSDPRNILFPSPVPIPSSPPSPARLELVSVEEDTRRASPRGSRVSVSTHKKSRHGSRGGEEVYIERERERVRLPPVEKQREEFETYRYVHGSGHMEQQPPALQEEIQRRRSRSITYESNPRASGRLTERERVVIEDDGRRKEYYRRP